MLSKEQRDKLRKAKEGIPGSPEFKRAKAAAIKRAEVEKCYRQYSPPQVRHEAS